MAASDPKVVALVLLGGAGTRLWPLSTDRHPKQFLRLFDRKSLFQKTLDRVRYARIAHTVLITNAALMEPLGKDLAELAGDSVDIILEPSRRDSAPAIAAGVAFIRDQFGPETIVAVLPSDHLIEDEAGFAGAVGEAEAVARDGWIVTFGIPPTHPATAFGYIERGAPIPGHRKAFIAKKFHEKPAEALASRYLASGGFDWNSGMFIFAADTFANEASTHMPDIWSAAGESVAAGTRTVSTLLLDAETFGSARKTSIDFALMEKSDKIGTLPARFDWSDVGNWAAVYDALGKDAQQNVRIGDTAIEDCTGSLIIGEGLLAAAMGLRHAILIVTPHGTFTAPRTRAPEIKQLLDARK